MQIKAKIVSCHKANSKLVKQVVNSTVILPLLVFLALNISNYDLNVNEPKLNQHKAELVLLCHIFILQDENMDS
jgi:hypothetical protein